MLDDSINDERSFVGLVSDHFCTRHTRRIEVQKSRYVHGTHLGVRCIVVGCCDKVEISRHRLNNIWACKMG